MKTYYEEREQVRETATQKFDALVETKDASLNGMSDREIQNARKEAVKAAIADWQKTKGVYDSIERIERSDRIEIRCHRFNGSIDISKPRAEHTRLPIEQRTAENEGYGKVIRPGYVSGSSWEAGSYTSSISETRDEMLVRMKMMELALESLNQVNSLVLEWKDIENPFQMTRWQQNELKTYKEKEQAELKKQAEKNAEREAKKARR